MANQIAVDSPARTENPSGSSGAPVMLNASSAVGRFLDRFVSSSSRSRIALALAELAASLDSGADRETRVVAVSGINVEAQAGQAAAGLACLWARWGHSVCLVDLASGPNSLGGAISSTSPDLAVACDLADAGDSLATLARLHPKATGAAVIAAGKADVLALISTGRLLTLVRTLCRRHDRVVLAAPSMQTGFPFLSLQPLCSHLVVAAVRGKSRGGPLRELAEQALRAGLPPLDVIWFD